MREGWILLGMMLLLPSVAGAIVLSPQPNAEAYLGDVLNSSIFVSSQSATQGLLSASLICADFRLDYYTVPVYLNSSSPAKVTLPSVPFNAQMLGTCKVLMQLRTFENVLLEQLDSFTFTVRNVLPGNITGIRIAYDPNETMQGVVRIVRPGSYQGTLSVEGLGSNRALNFSGSLSSFLIPLAFDAAPGVYAVRIALSDAHGNSFSEEVSFSVQAVARNVSLLVREDTRAFLPGRDIRVESEVIDQIGEDFETEGEIRLEQAGRVLAVVRGEPGAETISLDDTLAPGTYTLRALYGGLETETNIEVLALAQLAIHTTGDTVYITNTGNVPYESDLTLRGNDGERDFLIPLSISLLPEARQQIRLSESLPLGTYALSLETGTQTFQLEAQVVEDNRDLTAQVSQGVSLLTGNAIIDTDSSVGFFGVLVLIGLVCLGIYQVLNTRFKRRVFGTLHTVSEEQGKVMHSLHHSLQEEQKQSANMRELFGKYVDHDVLQAVEHTKDGIEMRKQPVSTLFCDLRGFSSMFEHTDEVTISRLLDLYLSTVSKVVKKEGGMINKFVGDAAMALFNAPRPLEDHALRAIRAGLALQKELVSINQQLEREGLPRLRVGVGVATGTAAVGTLGKGGKTEYTAIGASVNLAARLQAIAKEGEVLIDGVLAKQLGTRVQTEHKGKQALKNIGTHDVYRVVRA